MAAILPLFVAGCSPNADPIVEPEPTTSQTSDGNKPYAGTTITVGMEAGSFGYNYYSTVLDQFTAETGIEVEVVATPKANMRQQYLADAIAGTGDFDVYVLDQPWLPEFASKGYLVSLEDKIPQADRADFLAGTLDTMSFDGTLYGLPYTVHNLILFYRTDLFEAAGIDGPPTTWEEYRDYAKRLTDSASGIWGTVIESNQDGEVGIRYQSRYLQTGNDIVDSSGQPLIDTPEALETFELMLAMQYEDQSSPTGVHDIQSIRGQFLEGNAAMVMMWPYLVGMASDPEQSKVVDKFSIALNPGNPDQAATTFAWGWGIATGSKNQEAALEWVKWSTSPEVLEDLSRKSASPVPSISVNEKLSSDPSISEVQQTAFGVVAESISLSKTMPMTTIYPQYQEALGIAVSSVMSQIKDPAAALEEAQAAMDAAYQDNQ